VFEQALSMGLLFAIVFLIVGYGAGGWMVTQIASDELTARDARTYLYWYLPALATMFVNAPLGAALRASGVVGIPMMIQSGTVVINAVLAPVLIMGFLTGHPMGVAGAGLASSIAALFGGLGFVVMFNRAQKYMHLHPSLHPKWNVWKRITAIGLPATGEFAMIFITSGVAYWAIRGFGPQAQAGYGIGARIMQAVFLPAMAVAFATGPIAGQNFGARNAQRVRDTFRHAAVMGGAIMLGVTLLCQISPHVLVAPFSDDPAVVDVATGFLRIASWNFVAVGLTFCCSGMFQALGDTKPALLSSGSRLLTYVIPAIWLAGQSWTSLQDFWYLSLASITVQAMLALLLLRHQLHHKLKLFSPDHKIA
jgi:putative MATE family efflux protein